MYKLNLIDKIAFILVIIGALIWGILGISNFNLVHALFESIPAIERIIYILVGLAGIDLLLLLFKSSK